jgi:hypothetical protein
MSEIEFEEKFAGIRTWHLEAMMHLDRSLQAQKRVADGLFDVMNSVGETRLRQALATSCPELEWEDALR